jgi:hypothetical protein
MIRIMVDMANEMKLSLMSAQAESMMQVVGKLMTLVRFHSQMHALRGLKGGRGKFPGFV